VALSLFADFETSGRSPQQRSRRTRLNAMLDQVVAWSGALKGLRDAQAPVALAS